MWGVKIIIVILKFISINSQTLDELKNNPYNYYMFENFEMCKEVYKTESLELVPKIQLIRNMLEQRKKFIEKYLESKEIINNLNNLKSKQWEQEQGITPEANKTYFPTDQDYEGATLGLVRLVRTYQVNLTLLSDYGLVQYQGTTTNQKMFNSYERLSAIDYMALAMKAQQFKMFDVAIEFSREILRLLPRETGSIMVPDIVRQSFYKMRHDLVTLNNQYLMKTKMIEDREFLILPYLIDNELNRKRKQPKFIRQNNFNSLPKKENLPFESAFMGICREGKRKKHQYYGKAKHKYHGNTKLHCRYLHHHDPYLKLGPFKEDQRSAIPYAVIFRDIFRGGSCALVPND